MLQACLMVSWNKQKKRTSWNWKIGCLINIVVFDSLFLWTKRSLIVIMLRLEKSSGLWSLARTTRVSVTYATGSAFNLPGLIFHSMLVHLGLSPPRQPSPPPPSIFCMVFVYTYGGTVSVKVSYSLTETGQYKRAKSDRKLNQKNKTSGQKICDTSRA